MKFSCMSGKNNESFKTNFNQCYPITPSIYFYKTIQGLCLYITYCANHVVKTPTGSNSKPLSPLCKKSSDSSCISNSELFSHCKIVSVEQHILALTNNCRR